MYQESLIEAFYSEADEKTKKDHFQTDWVTSALAKRMLHKELPCDTHETAMHSHGGRMGITCTKTWNEGWLFPTTHFV